MSDAVDVEDKVGAEQEEPQSFLPPPTFPASLLADAGGADSDGAHDGGHHDTGDSAPAPFAAADPIEPPAKQGLLIRLGHRLCGFH